MAFTGTAGNKAGADRTEARQGPDWMVATLPKTGAAQTRHSGAPCPCGA